MDGLETQAADLTPRARKRRIPKACGTCRQSKVKCDGNRPCSRCHGLKKVCTFVERPKDANEAKIEDLEREVQSLRDLLQARAKLDSPQQDLTQGGDVTLSALADSNDKRRSLSDVWGTTSHPTTSPLSIPFASRSNDGMPRGSMEDSSWQPSISTNSSPNIPLSFPAKDLKRKRSVFVVRDVDVPDITVAGLLTTEQAEACFAAFFQGCDRYVPIFDSRYDSLESIRRRSTLLFSVMCAVGYRVTSGTETQEWHRLDFHIKRMLTAAITTSTRATLEVVQALLVRACYASERSLLMAIATRMAIELGLPEAFDELTGRLVARKMSDAERTHISGEDDAALMRKARTWLHLLVLANILHVDAGSLPSFEFRGNVRRCRILLESQFSTALDLALFSQVELNILRSEIYSKLADLSNCDDDDIMDVVTDAKIDIEVWFNDWMHITERYHADLATKQTNQVNLEVQSCWSDCMALCRAVRTSGVENVDAMSPSQRHILSMAKEAPMRHFSIIIQEPRSYLRNLRYAMDFVWAKCAFCYLLLLKLSVLLPDGTTKPGRCLVEDGIILINELGTAVGGPVGQGGNSTSRIYLRLLQTGIDKYRRAIRADSGESMEMTSDSGLGKRTTGSGSDNNRQEELESFVPDQFIFEWDFPGLTLFSSPMLDTGWLDEFLSGPFGLGDEPLGIGWLQA